MMVEAPTPANAPKNCSETRIDSPPGSRSLMQKRLGTATLMHSDCVFVDSALELLGPSVHHLSCRTSSYWNILILSSLFVCLDSFQKDCLLEGLQIFPIRGYLWRSVYYLHGSCAISFLHLSVSCGNLGHGNYLI